MELFYICLFLFLASSTFFYFSIKKSNKANTLLEQVHKINTEIDNQNKALERYNNDLKKYNKELRDEKIKIEKGYLEESISSLMQQSQNLNENIQNTYNQQKELSQKAFANYCEILDSDYKTKNEEYDKSIELLKDSYSKKQLIIISQLENEQKKLDEIKATREAALAAQIKEKEIKEKLSFYCLPLKASDKHDIKLLEDVKEHLTQPRILNMLIWQTYFQKPMNTLCNNVLGVSTVTGIYKITNQKNGMCYIGQSRNIADRWKQHAKCGLGIDTPANNKLYKAIQEDGIWNFSWELLEKCSGEELDKKEVYYINLYQSYEFGYNSNTGNKR